MVWRRLHLYIPASAHTIHGLQRFLVTNKQTEKRKQIELKTDEKKIRWLNNGQRFFLSLFARRRRVCLFYFGRFFVLSFDFYRRCPCDAYNKSDSLTTIAKIDHPFEGTIKSKNWQHFQWTIAVFARENGFNVNLNYSFTFFIARTIDYNV